jgi:WD40 repeat protein
LAIGGGLGPKNGRVDVWDLHSGVKPITLPSLPRPPWKAVFTPDDRLVLSFNGQIMVCSGERYRSVETIQKWDPLSTEYSTASLSPDGRWMLVDTSSFLRLIDLRSPFPEVWRQPPPANRLTPGGASFSPDGRYMAVKGQYTVELWELLTGAFVRAFERPSPMEQWAGYHLLWSPDGRWVCEQAQQWVSVWDATSGARAFQRIARNEWINDVAFHPASGRLGLAIAGRSDGVVRFYSPDDWREEVPFAWPVGRVQAIAFNTDGTLAAVGGDRPEVIVWDMD